MINIFLLIKAADKRIINMYGYYYNEYWRCLLSPVISVSGGQLCQCILVPASVLYNTFHPPILLNARVGSTSR